jgi:phosphoribosylanthranilate isomerase
MTSIKVCGITTLDDALAAAELGADMIGLNFYPSSPRSITWPDAQNLIVGLRNHLGDATPLIVGLFVNEDWQTIVAAGMIVDFDFAQLSGDEKSYTLARLAGNAIKAIRPETKDEALSSLNQYVPFAPDDDRMPSLILDAYHPTLYGGTGEQASTNVALAVKDCVPRLMLAGGLTPENVAERVAAIQPWGVDVASGVENGTPGRKDHGKMRAFIDAVRSVEVH